ncbi:MAG: macro domain-containing protein [Candidatus Dormibacteria bacterium]
MADARAAADSGVTAIRADITTVAAEAIVNAANQHLAGGGGVDGAIHRAGGPVIMAELRSRHRGCPTGEAVITAAGSLPARHVIHAVGPRWRDGAHGEPEQLRSAYRSAFRLAREHGCATVVSPSISTGIYGFPIAEAAPIAVEAAVAELATDGTPVRRITFALLSAADLAVFTSAIAAVTPPPAAPPAS